MYRVFEVKASVMPYRHVVFAVEDSSAIPANWLFVCFYRSNQDSAFYEEDFQGRNVIEPPFSDSFKIGGYQAHDYFGDGSLYVLNVSDCRRQHRSGLYCLDQT